jgi:hypothetical protein
MARRDKEALIQVVLAALVKAGVVAERLSPPNIHPARFAVGQGAQRQTLRIYIWNLSHGGKSRSKEEFRIQITGVEQFEDEPGGKTLILGWDDGFGVFAGFDISKRLAQLGSSPSVQINAAALRSAADQGGAVQAKRAGEFAAAIRPDRLDAYVENLLQIHAGDVSPLLGEGGRDDDLEARFGTLAKASEFDFGRPDDPPLRAKVREDANALIAALEPHFESESNIGHNHPPEPIDDTDLSPQIFDAAKLIRDQAETQEPDGGQIAKAGGFLAWASKALKTAKAEGKALVEKGKDKARELAVAGALLLFDKIFDLLIHLVKAVWKWLQVATGAH